MSQRKPELIVALDVEEREESLQLVDALRGMVGFYKVGSRLFTAEGPRVIGEIRRRRCSVFLDLKFHDIPATVAGSVRAAVGLGVRMMTLHTSGGLEMMRAAAETAAGESARLGIERPILVGVTVLTSLSKKDLSAVAPFEGEVRDLALALACRAKEAGLDGVVASVWETAEIKRELGGGFVTVTPGIRPAGSAVGDQKRVATPRAAAEAGSDYIVVGRPIIQAHDPVAAAEAILGER
jgi:orotidine-5'-phosphate decarboxylase